MHLTQFIEQIGHAKISKALGLSLNAVQNWKHQKVCPRPIEAYKLILLSHGVLTWESIYEPLVKKQLKGKTLKLHSIHGAQLEFKL